MEYITCSCRKTSKCLTSICECRDNGVHCTDLCKYSGCENEKNIENEEWNYSDIDTTKTDLEYRDFIKKQSSRLIL